MYKGLNPRFEIKDSPIEGKGIFAKMSIKNGDIITVNLDPQPIKVYEFTDEEFEKFKADCIKNGQEWDSVSLGNGMHHAAVSDRDNHPENFGNHSCDPNTAPKDGQLVAIRDIEPGEELTGDYAEFSDVNWSMKCNCGSKKCRGIVKGKIL